MKFDLEHANRLLKQRNQIHEQTKTDMEHFRTKSNRYCDEIDTLKLQLKLLKQQEHIITINN